MMQFSQKSIFLEIFSIQESGFRKDFQYRRVCDFVHCPLLVFLFSRLSILPITADWLRMFRLEQSLFQLYGTQRLPSHKKTNPGEEAQPIVGFAPSL